MRKVMSRDVLLVAAAVLMLAGVMWPIRVLNERSIDFQLQDMVVGQLRLTAEQMLSDDKTLASAIYGCTAITVFVYVPCPDYTAHVEFRGESSDTPPLLTAAYNAAGKQVLRLDARFARCRPGVCPRDHWEVAMTPIGDVVVFGVNTKFEKRWGVMAWHTNTLRQDNYLFATGTPIEIYVADRDIKVLGAPLDRVRVGA